MSYLPPTTAALRHAVTTADTLRESAPAANARMVCTVIAAAVRDILTNDTPGARFDAAALELVLDEGTGGVHATGTYWTVNGEQRRITEQDDVDGLAEWTRELNSLNRSGWQPLCESEPRRGTAGRPFRLNLMRAAQLPTDADLAAARRENALGYRTVADALNTGGPGAVRLEIRYAHQWYLTAAQAEFLHLGEGALFIGIIQSEALRVVTEIAETALRVGAATLEMTTSHPDGTSTVQCLTFTADRGAEVDESYSLTAPARS